MIPTAKGGHSIELALSGNCWMCITCRGRSTSWRKLATSSCSPTKVKELTKLVAVDGIKDGSSGRRHTMVASGAVHWCETCGCFAESRTNKRMQAACPGPPHAAAGNGWMRQQLMALRAGLHPVTGMRLPAASGSTTMGSGTYTRLKPKEGKGGDFIPYVPTVFEASLPTGGESAERKRWLLRGRIPCKQNKEARRLKKLRRKVAKAEVCEAIRSFVDGQCDYAPVTEVGGDNSDEEFWLTLPAMDTRVNRIQGIPSQPGRAFPGKATRLREEVLKVNCQNRGKDDQVHPGC